MSQSRISFIEADREVDVGKSSVIRAFTEKTKGSGRILSQHAHLRSLASGISVGVRDNESQLIKNTIE